MAVLLIPARAAHTVTREVDGEFLVLDESTGRALCLSGPSAAVWAVAGTDQRPTGLTDERVNVAVAELTELGLLVSDGIDRRSMLKRAGLVGAAATVASIVLPMASAAASTARAITLIPTSGPKGSTVSVSGVGYPAGQLITITFNGVTVTTSPAAPVTSGTGTFSGVTFVVPNNATVAGAGNTVAAVAGAQSASATFTVPAATLVLKDAGGTTVSSGPKQVLTVSGSGYLPGSTITFKFDATTVGTATADGSGNIPASTTITVPSAATVAAHSITATDVPSNQGTAAYTVVAPTITPATANVARNANTSYTIASSSGFAPSASFTVTLSGGFYASLSPTSGTTTAGGAITPTTYSFTTSGGSGRTGTLVFTDNFGNTASVTLTTV